MNKLLKITGVVFSLLLLAVVKGTERSVYKALCPKIK